MLHTIVKGMLDRGVANFNEETVMRFVEFMNVLGQQMYLRKTIPFLVFIGHCVSIDKCNILFYKRASNDSLSNFYIQRSSMYK